MYNTLQELFNDAWTGLKAQGFAVSTKNWNGTIICAYRGDNGLKCAIGHCIPDDEYTPYMEQKAASYLGIFPSFLFPYLDELQQAHDHNINLENPYCSLQPENYTTDVESNLRKFASKHSLTIPGSE